MSAIEQTLERYRRAVTHRLRLVKFGEAKSAKTHLAASGKTLSPNSSPYALCGAKWFKAKYLVGASVYDRGVCKECIERLNELTRAVAAAQKRDLWQIASGDKITVSAEEVKEALNAPTFWGEFEPIQQSLLPEDYLPKGSGQLLKRAW